MGDRQCGNEGIGHAHDEDRPHEDHGHDGRHDDDHDPRGRATCAGTRMMGVIGPVSLSGDRCLE